MADGSATTKPLMVNPGRGRSDLPTQTVVLGERFRAKVRKDDSGCWLWIGGCDSKGYGRFKAGGVRYAAHRVAYFWWREPIAPDLALDHLCRVHNCVNPAHLEPVTWGENIRRGNLGRLRTHCNHGHPLTEDNVRIYRGGRICQACRLQRSRDWRSRHGSNSTTAGVGDT